ncbi:BZ3500_MvSof-1268-A1-R1_Chr5-2g08028 [Microbotryum saponariae]|uniref:BZ3500_MvSof-1268-A1-R1_Chr5-2g08028 protein n=1 Tax=Microbotryum saponariae TaxID=289078 RepID=A0A2X0MEN4_9BASI|nr:BZ3500_MvSof-1268-A1-R1_Chr5-2g08028 [Microbotryum saponariae]SDA05897.1 BZ3501_MvSof-1269-A2-R1_Chr5-2g07850 [Microbotryum saponariae]
MVNSEVSLKPLLATNVPMIFTLLVPVNFTETGHRFVYLRDILEEVAELTGLALQEDSCFDYWVVDDAATSSTHSTPCLASCRYDQLAAFTAATDSSDKVLGLTGFVLDIDSLPAEATITLRLTLDCKCHRSTSTSRLVFILFFTGAHKLQSFGLAGTARKRAKRGYKATTASNWVKVKPLRAKSAAQIKTRRAPNADSNGR